MQTNKYGFLMIDYETPQLFKDWCITNQNTISLPTAMKENGSGNWIIID